MPDLPFPRRMLLLPFQRLRHVRHFVQDSQIFRDLITLLLPLTRILNAGIRSVVSHMQWHPRIVERNITHIANSSKVNLRYLKDAEIYLEEDIRMEREDFMQMDARLFEEYIKVGKKADSIRTLLKLLKK